MEQAKRIREKKRIPAHWLVYGGVAVLAFFLFVHPDVIETANHSWLFLDSLFKGRIAYFYEDVMAHANTLYYINNAHYSIVLYGIFALFELPVYAFCALLGRAPNEVVLYFVGKLVGTVFFLGCIFLCGRLARVLGMDRHTGRLASLWLALWPPAFFSVLVMGQYDSVPLFFLLLGLFLWLKDKKTAGSIWIGVGAACKFLPLLAFLPLLLLWEKRPLHILRHGLISLWLVVPTGLLYAGRGGDMPVFNGEMLNRLFGARLYGMGSIPLFPLLYAVLCVFAYFWRPQKPGRAGMWLALAALGLLFLFVVWHPQWLVLLAPFVVLTGLAQRRTAVWHWLDVLLCAGFFLYCALSHPYHLEANLLDFGLVGILGDLRTSGTAGYNAISFYLALVPVLTQLPNVLFCAALLGGTLVKMPLSGGSLAARLGAPASLSSKARPDTQQPGGATLAYRQSVLWLWASFAVGIAFWLVPTAFTWLKCFGFL